MKDIKLKYCGYCKKNLPTSSFSPRKQSPDGLRPICRECRKLEDKHRRKVKSGKIQDIPTEEKKELKEKRRLETNKKVYNVEHPIQSSDIRKKMESTLIELYGVDNYAKSPGFEEQRSKTVKEKYNVNSYFQTEDFQKQRVATCIKKYNKPYPNIIERWVLPNGDYINSYAKKHGKSIGHCKTLYELYGFDTLVNWAENDIRPDKTSIETLVESLTGLKYYGRRLKEIERYPDFKIDDNLYLDIDGLYWHSELYRDYKYHYNKFMEYEKAGLRLLQIRENELRLYPEIFISMVNNARNINILSIGARECKVKKVEWNVAKEFYLENHIQGHGTTAKSIGLFYNDELIQTISYKQRFGHEGIIEISRFATAKYLRVVGGFSRLLKHVIDLSNPIEVHSFCDLRYSRGKVYSTNGFTEKSMSIGWSWTDFENVFNRLQCTAIDGKTEKEHAKELGWSKIYDAGQRLYVLKIM